MRTAEDTPTLLAATDEMWHTLVAQSADQPVLVYVTAPWCNPCKVFGPLVQAYAADHAELRIYRADCDVSPFLCEQLDVALFPTLALMRHGVVQWSRAGAMDAGELDAVLGAVTEAARHIDAAPLDVPADENGQSRTIEVGHITDPRVRLEVVRRTNGADGTESIESSTVAGRIALGDKDGLRLFAEADERMPHPLDLSLLSDLPAAPYEHVIVHARSLPAEEIAHLTRLRDIRTLLVSALEPLSDEAFDALVDVRARAVHAHVPGIDVQELRRRMPGTSVNYASMSAQLAAHLPPTTSSRAPITWTSVDELDARIARGERTVAMVQIEHSADDQVAESWLLAPRTGALADALSISAHGRDLATVLALEASRPAIVIWESGRLICRSDLPESPAEIVDVVQSASWDGNAAPAVALDRPARTISLDTAGADAVRVELTLTGTASSGAVVDLRPGHREDVPEGWCVRVRAHVAGEEDLPLEAWAHLRIQALHLSGAVDDEVLSRLGFLTHLEHLEIMSSEPPTPSALALAVQTLPTLRSVRVYGLRDSAALSAANASLIINGAWPAHRPQTGDQ